MKVKAGLTLWLLVAAVLGFTIPSASAATQGLPEGDYQYTCMGCMRNLDLLICTCPDEKGQMKPTNLMLSGCNREISNRDGKLVCG